MKFKMLKQLLESRDMYSISMIKDELSDLSDDLAIDGIIPNKLKASSITDEQALAYIRGMESLDYQGSKQSYSDDQYNLARKIFMKK